MFNGLKAYETFLAHFHEINELYVPSAIKYIQGYSSPRVHRPFEITGATE